MAVIVSGLEIKGKMSGIGNYKCRRQKLVIDAGQATQAGEKSTGSRIFSIMNLHRVA
jgi:hypothetical protein